ncbi:MAG: electron transport complex subunit RsxC, partial [Spirochaetaceae bacterium]|nr:electron transport complex subunit RsxC [Spirochaetaceae bacterium]
VTRGQKIASSDGKLMIPHHASICGVVKKIEPRPQSNLLDGVAIVIEADGRTDTAFLPPLDPFSCTKEEALTRIKEAGIVGMGGAGFPTWMKLSPPPSKPIDVVIANGAECEPYLTIDYRTLLECSDALVYGMAASLKTLGVKKGVFAVEDNKTDVVPVMEKAIAAFQAGAGADKGFQLSVEVLKTKYPQGGEKMLIQAITGREVPSGGLPMDVAAVVQNLGTLKAIADAFQEGKPLIDRSFTATGGACKTPKNICVPIGTVVSDLIPDIIDVRSDVARVLYGGPMMGVSVPTLDTPVQKNTSGVVFLTTKEARFFDESSCIRCGRCMRACSCRLSPALMNEAILAENYAEAEAIGLLDCIECGVCSYMCPARVRLVQRFRVGKMRLRAIKAAEQAKEKARAEAAAAKEAQ